MPRVTLFTHVVGLLCYATCHTLHTPSTLLCHVSHFQTAPVRRCTVLKSEQTFRFHAAGNRGPLHTHVYTPRRVLWTIFSPIPYSTVCVLEHVVSGIKKENGRNMHVQHGYYQKFTAGCYKLLIVCIVGSCSYFSLKQFLSLIASLLGVYGALLVSLTTLTVVLSSSAATNEV